MNNRRKLIVALGAASLTPRTVFAQPKKPPAVIGWLHSGSAKTDAYMIAAFREGMVALGWREGTQFLIEERWAESRVDRTQTLAEELLAKKPAVFVTPVVSFAAVLAKLAPRIPIVVGSGGDLVSAGLATSLARPGGMVTGLTNIGVELTGKRAELLLEAVPGIRNVGVLSNPEGRASADNLAEVQRALARYSIKPLVGFARRPDEIEAAIASLAKDGAQALMIQTSAWFGSQRAHIMKLALAQRWPVIAPSQAYAEASALLTYGPNSEALWRRAASYVDRILKGAKPGDLPIEQPTTFDLVVNMKTAKALRITVPPTIMVRATRVIE